MDPRLAAIFAAVVGSSRSAEEILAETTGTYQDPTESLSEEDRYTPLGMPQAPNPLPFRLFITATGQR